MPKSLPTPTLGLVRVPAAGKNRERERKKAQRHAACVLDAVWMMMVYVCVLAGPRTTGGENRRGAFAPTEVISDGRAATTLQA